MERGAYLNVWRICITIAIILILVLHITIVINQYKMSVVVNGMAKEWMQFQSSFIIFD